jgi:capsular exopolysaccharide synthesis family protein
MAEIYSPPVVELDKLWNVFHRRWKLMIATAVVVLCLGAAYTLSCTPVYESKAMLMVASPQAVSSNPGDPGLMSDLAAITKNRSVKSQTLLITSPEILNTAIGLLGTDRIKEGYHAEQLPEWALDVRAEEDTDIISVMVKSYDARVSADLAELVCAAYIDTDLKRNSEATRKARQYVSSELKSVQVQLADARKELADFKRSTKLVVTDEQMRALAGNELALEAERDKARVDLASANSEKGMLQSQLKQQGTEIQESTTVQISPQYQDAMLTLGRLYTERAALVQEYTADSKEVKQIEARIADAEKQMRRFADRIIASKVRTRNPLVSSYVSSLVSSSASAARVRALDRAIIEKNRRLDKLPDQERSAIRLAQRVSNLDGTYNMLCNKYYTLMINEKSLMPNAHIISNAQLPKWPVAPNKSRNAVRFLLLAILASICSAWVAERLDQRVRDETLFVEITGQPPLAAVPDSKQPNLKVPMAAVNLQKDAFLEPYRLLRNSIAFAALDRPMKLLAVTSPGRGDGKSTTAVNLAASVALAGKRVLLVDCDLHSPGIHKYLELPANPGLSELLGGSIDLDEAVQGTEIKNMYCVSAGSCLHDTSEILQSEGSRQPFARMAHEFDLVLLDCPPCSGISDMQVISQIVDGVIFVVALNHSVRRGIYDGLLNLKRVDAPVIGYVANRLNSKRVVRLRSGNEVASKPLNN